MTLPPLLLLVINVVSFATLGWMLYKGSRGIGRR